MLQIGNKPFFLGLERLLAYTKPTERINRVSWGRTVPPAEGTEPRDSSCNEHNLGDAGKGITNCKGPKTTSRFTASGRETVLKAHISHYVSIRRLLDSQYFQCTVGTKA